MLQFVEPAVPDLFSLLIEVWTPKTLWPKLCETMLPVLVSVPSHKVFQFLTAFIEHAANHNAKRQRLAVCFKELMDKVAAISSSDQSAARQLSTKVQFKQYLIGFAHRIRSIVTVH